MKKAALRRILSMVMSAPYNGVMLRAFRVKVGSGLMVNGWLVIRGRKGLITIGERVFINSCRLANPIGGDTRTILWTLGGGKITIGDDVGISNSAIVARESVTIGNQVMIGGGCKIYDSDFHSLNLDERTRIPETGIHTKPVVIRNGAFIGAHSTVLKGVTIGERSVVGACSVVTKNIPDREIWAGNPARYIRKLDAQIAGMAEDPCASR